MNITFRLKRPVPYAAQPLVDQKLRRLERLGVLVPVTCSSWVVPIVVVKKSNGSIPIRGDLPTGLNVALEPNCYPLPVHEDIFTMLNGGTYFAKLDFAKAYLKLEVAPKSRGEGITGKVLQDFLFAYCTTPNSATSDDRSPAKDLVNRKLRTDHQALIPTNEPTQLTGPNSHDGFPIGDTFAIPDTDASTVPLSHAEITTSFLPRRWTDRNRRPHRPMQLDL